MRPSRVALLKAQGMTGRQRSSSAITRWMRANVNRFVDQATDEIDTTGMVEAWDRECATGKETLNPAHPAWDLAIEVVGS